MTTATVDAPMATTTKVPTCHPDAPYTARGLCRRCYVADRNGKPAPVGTGRRYNVLGTRLNAPPPRLDGLTHHCFTEWPDTCPKCHRAIALTREGRELWCRGVGGGCGWTGYLVVQEAIDASALPLNRKGELVEADP